MGTEKTYLTHLLFGSTTPAYGDAWTIYLVDTFESDIAKFGSTISFPSYITGLGYYVKYVFVVKVTVKGDNYFIRTLFKIYLANKEKRDICI